MDESLFALYNPVAPPTQQVTGNVWGGGFTPGAQNAASYFGAQPGAPQPNMPIGSGNTMYPGANQFSQEDIRNVGITTGGPKKEEAYIPEAMDSFEAQTNMFSDAYNKGYTTTEDTRGDLAAAGAVVGGAVAGYASAGVGMGVGASAGAAVGGAVGGIVGHKVGETGAAGTMEAARMAKRDDRVSDRKVRKEAQKEIEADLIAGGMKKGKARRQARRAKRQLRRGMRRGRKDAWKTFKGDQKLKRQDDAYNYEQKYS